jgi:hypothetical protein
MAARRAKTVALGIVVGAVALVGVAVGIAAGVHYYNTHSGDWRIGVTAVGIAAGVVAGTAAVAAIAWWLVRPRRYASSTSEDLASLTPPTSNYETTNLIDILAMLGSIGAGVYLLQYQSAGNSATGTSWFEIIGHGMGIYFIAKGLFIARTTYLQADARNKLAQLVEIANSRAPEPQDPRPPGPGA